MSCPYMVTEGEERRISVAWYPSFVSLTSPSILYPPLYDVGKKHEGTPCKQKLSFRYFLVNNSHQIMIFPEI